MATTVILQGSAERWALGCVKRAFTARGDQDTEITQPSQSLYTHFSVISHNLTKLCLSLSLTKSRKEKVHLDDLQACPVDTN